MLGIPTQEFIPFEGILTANSVPFISTNRLLKEDASNFFWNDTTNTLVLGGTQLHNEETVSIKRTSTESAIDTFALEAQNNPTIANSETTYTLRFTTLTTHTTGTMAKVQGIGGSIVSQSNGNITESIGISAGIVYQAPNTPTITTTYSFKAGIASFGNSTATDYISYGGESPTLGIGSLSRAYFIKIPSFSVGTTQWGINSAMDVQVNSDVKLILEGNATTKGDTYFIYDSTGTTLDCFVDGSEMWNSNSLIVNFVKDVDLTSVGFKATNISTNTTLGATHFIIYANASSADVTLTLPAASGARDRIYIIKRIDNTPGNVVTIDGNGAETIDDIASYILTTQYDYVWLQCDGTEWFIIG